MFRKLCGDAILKNTIIATTMWSEVSLELGSRREQELMSHDFLFKPALEKGAQLMRHDDTVKSAHRIIEKILENHPIVLRIQREIICEKKDITKTDACQELDRSMAELRKSHKRDMANFRKELEQAMRKRDFKQQEQLMIVRERTQRYVYKCETKRAALSREFEEERRRRHEEIEACA